MKRKAPRVQYDFHVVQTPNDTNYVPLPSRMHERVALFEGGPRGIVIATDQKIGCQAVANVFEWLSKEGDESSIRSASQLFAYTSLGTAYHLYAQNAVSEVMYRQVPLPRAMPFSKDESFDETPFIDEANRGLQAAVDSSSRIKQALVEQRAFSKLERPLGKILARTGLVLAVLSEDIQKQQGTRVVEAQDDVYMACQRTYAQMMELSGSIRARPTVAQLANPRSPLMQYLHDTPEALRTPVYDRLNDEVQELTLHESRL